MSDSLWHHGLLHIRLSHPSLYPRVCSNSCPLSRWCHPTISSSIAPFSSCPQSFPASGSFPMSQLFATGGQSIGASSSMSVLPMNIQGWFPLGLTSLISLLSKGLSRVFTSSTVWQHQFFRAQPSLVGFPSSSAGKEYACNAGDPGLIPGSGRSSGEGTGSPPQYSWASLVAQLVKNPPVMRETWVRSLGWEIPLKKWTSAHSSILAWRIPWTV